MKYRSKQQKNRSSRMSHKSLIGIVVATTVLIIGVVTALSMQKEQPQKATIEGRKPQVANEQRRNYVTSNAAGQTVVVDRATGQARPLTTEEARRLAEGIKQLVNQSSEGLVQVQHANGSVSMDLQGRFQSVMLAKIEDDGTVSQACVDNPESAAAFFEIDPALLGIAAPVSTSAPNSVKPEIR